MFKSHSVIGSKKTRAGFKPYKGECLNRPKRHHQENFDKFQTL